MVEMGEELLRVKDVYKIFGPQPRGRAFELSQGGMGKGEVHARTGHVVGRRDVNFDVKRGEIFVIMGLSGAGKSTLGLAAMGFTRDGCEIVGGNIRHSTRVMTTSIALATSMGELAFAMALGIVLLLVALVVNIASQILRNSLRNFGHDV